MVVKRGSSQTRHTHMTGKGSTHTQGWTWEKQHPAELLMDALHEPTPQTGMQMHACVQAAPPVATQGFQKLHEPISSTRRRPGPDAKFPKPPTYTT
jgi:hypothetical protein